MNYLEIMNLHISDSSMFWTQVEHILLITSKIPFERLGFRKDRILEYIAAKIHLALMYT